MLYWPGFSDFFSSLLKGYCFQRARRAPLRRRGLTGTSLQHCKEVPPTEVFPGMFMGVIIQGIPLRIISMRSGLLRVLGEVIATSRSDFLVLSCTRSAGIPQRKNRRTSRFLSVPAASKILQTPASAVHGSGVPAVQKGGSGDRHQCPIS